MIQTSDEDGDFPYADWTAPYRTPVGRDALVAMQGENFDLLLGRRTYDLWSASWPKAPAGPAATPVLGSRPLRFVAGDHRTVRFLNRLENRLGIGRLGHCRSLVVDPV